MHAPATLTVTSNKKHGTLILLVLCQAAFKAGWSGFDVVSNDGKTAVIRQGHDYRARP